MNNFTIHDYDDPWIEPAASGTAYDYTGDNLRFFKATIDGRSVLFSLAVDDEPPVFVTVHVAEPKRVAVLDSMEELTYENIQGAFAV